MADAVCHQVFLGASQMYNSDTWGDLAWKDFLQVRTKCKSNLRRWVAPPILLSDMSDGSDSDEYSEEF